MSLILMTTLFYKAVILQGEIWRWSLLGLKCLKAAVYGDRWLNWIVNQPICQSIGNELISSWMITLRLEKLFHK